MKLALTPVTLAANQPCPCNAQPGFHTYLPELDGLRGLAILAVVLYHCNPRLEGTWIYYASLWGWAGVILFFVLSGFPDHMHSAGNAGQAALLSQLSCARGRCASGRCICWCWSVVYLNAPWFIGGSVWHAIKTAPWLAYIFCVQNLFHLALPPALGTDVGAGH